VNVAACSRTSSVLSRALKRTQSDAFFKHGHISGTRDTPLGTLKDSHDTHTPFTRTHSRSLVPHLQTRSSQTPNTITFLFLQTTSHLYFSEPHRISPPNNINFFPQTTSHFSYRYSSHASIHLTFNTPHVDWTSFPEHLAPLECHNPPCLFSSIPHACEEGGRLRRGAAGRLEQGEEGHVAPACPIRRVPLHPRHTPESSAANTRQKAQARMFDYLR